MTQSRKFTWILSLFVAAMFPLDTAFAQSCGTPKCAPNPVPCAHCAGTWTDNSGAVWTVSSNTTPSSASTWSVSGTVQSPAPPGCPTIAYQVSGSLTQTFGSSSVAGTPAISWTGSSPSPTAACGGYTPVPSITFTGNISNDGCDYASGTWLNSSGLNGSFTMTKPADVPDLSPAETTSVVAWHSLAPTVAVYEETIGASKYQAGRQTFEASNGSATDTCWFVGSMYSYGGLSGGGWYVGYYYFNNKFEYDCVGMAPAAVTYYRSAGRVPCLVTIPQKMSLYTHTGSAQYFTDTLYWNVPDATNYGVARNGVQAWRTYP